MKLDDVHKLPNLSRNLWSVSKSVDEGNAVVFNDKGVYVLRKNDVRFRRKDAIYTGKRLRNGLFAFILYPIKWMNDTLNSIPKQFKDSKKHSRKLKNLRLRQKSDQNKQRRRRQKEGPQSPSLWHQRLGHPNPRYLQHMEQVSRGFRVSGKASDGQRCVSCALGNVLNTSHPPLEHKRSDRVNQVIHVDMDTYPTSSKGYRYALVLVDDYSRFIHTYYMKRRYEGTQILRRHIRMIERQHAEKVSKIIMDQGTEISKIKSFCERRGIRLGESATAESNQNPIAERAHRKLQEKVRAMRSTASFPERAWEYTHAAAAYLANRSPSRPLKMKTPFEKWYGYEPHVGHLRVFGCAVVSRKGKKKLPKAQDHGEYRIMVGYDIETSNYLTMDPRTRVVTKTPNCWFFETEFPYARLSSGKEQYASDNDTDGTSASDSDSSSTEIPEDSGNIVPDLTEDSGKESEDSRNDVILPTEQNVTVKESQNHTQEQHEKNVSDATTIELVYSDKEKSPALDVPKKKEKTSSTMRKRKLSSTRGTKRQERSTTHIPKERPSRKRKMSTRLREAVDAKSTVSKMRRIMEAFAVEVHKKSSTRTRTMKKLMCMLCTFVLIHHDPKTRREAMKSAKWNEWKEAERKEFNALLSNRTWELVDLPDGRKPIDVKWVYKTKLNKDGTIERYKCRLVAKGFQQKKGIDYEETYSATLKHKSIRTILAIAATLRFPVHQIDIGTAFLNGMIDKTIYLKQAPGYVSKEHPNKVYKLVKSIYGLVQSPRIWYEELRSTLVKQGFRVSLHDPCIYYKKDSKGELLLVGAYVDDVLILGRNTKTIQTVKDALRRKYKVEDKGLARFIVGLEIEWKKNGILLHQKQYINKIAEQYELLNAKPEKYPMENRLDVSNSTSPIVGTDDDVPYRSLIGSLLYVLGTRPDVSYAVGRMARYCNAYDQSHWKYAKRIAKYLKSTDSHGIFFRFGARESSTNDTAFQLEAYTDAEFAGCKDTRRSVGGHVIFLNGCPIDYKSKLQTNHSLSVCEAEYVELSLCSQSLLWIRGILKEIGLKMKEPTPVREDNQAAIDLLSNDLAVSQRTKHIDVRYHFVRDLAAKGVLQVKYTPTERQIADILTKPMTGGRFLHLREALKVLSPQ